MSGGVHVYEPATGTVIETVDNGAGEQRQVVAAHLLDGTGTEISSANRLHVDVGDLSVQNLNVSFPDSVVSTLNSSTTPLAANAQFNGTWEEVTKYAAVSVVVLTDAPSALNGAVVEFSEDATNGPIRSQMATIPANVGLTFMFAPEARYFRLRLTNGNTAQTVLRAQTILHYQIPSPPQLPLGGVTSDSTLGESTVAHTRGRLSNGIWQPFSLTNAGALIVDGSGATQPVSGSVAVNNTPSVTDSYTGGQALLDQVPGGSAVTFTFASTMNLIWVKPTGGPCRVDPFGGTPTSNAGIPCDDGVPNPITINASTLEVFAQPGVTVSVWGFKY